MAHVILPVVPSPLSYDNLASHLRDWVIFLQGHRDVLSPNTLRIWDNTVLTMLDAPYSYGLDTWTQVLRGFRASVDLDFHPVVPPPPPPPPPPVRLREARVMGIPVPKGKHRPSPLARGVRRIGWKWRSRATVLSTRGRRGRSRRALGNP